jgi:hypothetical protein
MPETWGNLTMLRAAAENLTDAIQHRVSAENRALRGGAAIDAADRDRLCAIPRMAETEARKQLFSVYEEAVPDHIRAWAKSIPGLATGEVFPRLAGVVGNPRIAVPWKWETLPGHKRTLVPDGDPYERTPRQLFQWSGCGDPEKKPAPGMSQEELLACGRRTVVYPLLRTFTSYIARAGRPVTKEGSAKLGEPISPAVADSKYFKIFMEARAQGDTRVHQWECRNHKRPPFGNDGCGTTPHPEWGEIGSPWRPGHAEGHAHRITSKQLLLDYWIVAGTTPGGWVASAATPPRHMVLAGHVA